MDIIDSTRNRVTDIMYMIRHRKKATYFTRSTAKMQFADGIYIMLKGIRRTLQIEIDSWFEGVGQEVSMTKQSFSELRQKISPTAFIELNDVFVNWFYEDEAFKKYHGYRLFGVDGSITEIPNTECNREHFGYYHNQTMLPC